MSISMCVCVCLYVFEVGIFGKVRNCLVLCPPFYKLLNYDGAFFTEIAAIVVSYFQKKVSSQIFDRVLNTPLDGYPFPSYRWNITVGKLLNVGMAFILLYFTKNLKIFQ